MNGLNRAEGSGSGDNEATTGYEATSQFIEPTSERNCPEAAGQAFDAGAFIAGFSIPLVFLVISLVKLYSYHKQLQRNKQKNQEIAVTYRPACDDDKDDDAGDDDTGPRYEGIQIVGEGGENMSGYVNLDMGDQKSGACNPGSPDAPPRGKCATPTGNSARPRSECEDEDGYIAASFLRTFQNGASGKAENVNSAYEFCDITVPV